MSVPEEEEAIYRSVAVKNNDLSVNEYLDNSKSESSKKAVSGIKSMFNETMDSLNHRENTNQYKHLEDLSLEELPGCLSRFFMVVTKKDGICFNSSSLNTHYLSMVRYLKLRDTDPVDIQHDLRFSKVKEVLKARCLESVKAGHGAGINASQSLNSDELKQVMSSSGMSRENPKGLIALTHYVVMTGMGCRARQECRDMTNKDLIYGPNSDIEGIPQYITLNEKLTKTRRGGKGQTREMPGRVYMDPEYPNLCPVRTLVLYQSRKTDFQKTQDYPFFLTVKQSALKSPSKEMFWYTNSPMGVNLIGRLFTDAIKASNLDVGGKKITATSARKNLAQVGASASVPSALLSKLLGQKNLDSKINYVSNTEHTQKAACLAISRGVLGEDNQDFTTIYKDVKTTNSVDSTEEYVPQGKDFEQAPSDHQSDNDQSQQTVLPGPSHNFGNGNKTDPHYSGNSGNYYPPPPPPSYGYYQPPPPPQHFGYYPEPYYGYHHGYPPYHGHYQPPYVPPPPPSYYQPPPPQFQYNQHPPNQYALHQYNNYSFHSGQACPDSNQANDNRKRALTDISNSFTFKKPRM